MNLDYFKNVKQTWDFSIVNVDKKYPFLLIDNYYTPEEEKMIWQELEYYASWPKDLTSRAEISSNVSKDYEGKAKGYSWRFYLDRMYRRDEGYCSHIFNFQYKQKLISFQKAICKIKPYSSCFTCPNIQAPGEAVAGSRRRLKLYTKSEATTVRVPKGKMAFS